MRCVSIRNGKYKLREGTFSLNINDENERDSESIHLKQQRRETSPPSTLKNNNNSNNKIMIIAIIIIDKLINKEET